LLAVASEADVDLTLVKAATGLGGGVGRQGSLCGALTGSEIAIGLLCGRTRLEDERSKERTYDLCGQIFNWFKEAMGTPDCRALTNTDFSTPEGRESYRHSGVKESVCTRIVGDSARKVAELIRSPSG
jgi:C_GCAxxG_C_C family probable redox protein